MGLLRALTMLRVDFLRWPVTSDLSMQKVSSMRLTPCLRVNLSTIGSCRACSSNSSFLRLCRELSMMAWQSMLRVLQAIACLEQGSISEWTVGGSPGVGEQAQWAGGEGKTRLEWRVGEAVGLRHSLLSEPSMTQMVWCCPSAWVLLFLPLFQLLVLGLFDFMFWYCLSRVSLNCSAQVTLFLCLFLPTCLSASSFSFSCEAPSIAFTLIIGYLALSYLISLAVISLTLLEYMELTDVLRWELRVAWGQGLREGGRRVGFLVQWVWLRRMGCAKYLPRADYILQLFWCNEWVHQADQYRHCQITNAASTRKSPNLWWDRSGKERGALRLWVILDGQRQRMLSRSMVRISTLSPLLTPAS